ncbi:MAG: prepilin-type N-terminal cleavage/methylation domain-containing protein [Polyangiales bacterium]
MSESAPGEQRPSRRRRNGARGLTLVEVLVVVAVGALLAGGMVFGAGQLQRSRLRSSASRIAAAMHVAYMRASSTGKNLRLVVDIDAASIWIEESNDVMLLKTDDLAGSGGANAATDVERQAEEEANRIGSGVQTARATFHAVTGPAGQPQELYKGIIVKEVDAAHVSEAKTSGRGYVYFFGSEAERATVQVGIAGGDPEKDVFTIVLAPLTGRTKISDKAIAMKRPHDDAEASEAEDNGT